MDIDVQNELIAGLPVKVVRGNGYDRIQVGGKTIVYVNPSKSGVVLDFTVNKAIPRKFQTKALSQKVAGRARFTVDGQNVAKGRELLEWLVAA